MAHPGEGCAISVCGHLLRQRRTKPAYYLFGIIPLLLD